MIWTEHEENFRVVGDFSLKRTDPFGFWIIRSLKGETPHELKSESFTSTSQAVSKLENYLLRNPKKKKD